jgi:hypothetical protein
VLQISASCNSTAFEGHEFIFRSGRDELGKGGALRFTFPLPKENYRASRLEESCTPEGVPVLVGYC